MAYHAGAFPRAVRLSSAGRQQKRSFADGDKPYGDLRALRVVARRQLDDGFLRVPARHGDHNTPDLEPKAETSDAEMGRGAPDLRFLLDDADNFPRRKFHAGVAVVPGVRQFFPGRVFAGLAQSGRRVHDLVGGRDGDRVPAASGQFVP